MYDIRDEMKALAKRAIAIHTQEKNLVTESSKIIDQLERMNASVNLGYTKKAFAKALGVSHEVYWKRAQAGRIIRRFPRVEEMLKRGEMQNSHVNLIAPKITSANEKVLLDRVSGKSKREVQYAVATTDADGSVSDAEPEVEIRVVLKKSQMELLERAVEVMSSCGKQAKHADVLVAGLEQLLEKKDPIRKAERALARAERKSRDEIPDPGQKKIPEPDQAILEKAADTPPEIDQAPIQRPHIPALLKHQVYLRDQGRCTYVGSSGERCDERSMLELDHIKMWCRGGRHSTENMTLRCRYHNQTLAKKELQWEKLF